MNMKKMTNVQALEMVLSIEGVKNNTELFDKLAVMKAQFEKKANRPAGEKKDSANQIENKRVAGLLWEMLTEEPKEQRELQKALGIETSQKMTAIVKVLGEQVEKTKVKGITVLSRKA